MAWFSKHIEKERAREQAFAVDERAIGRDLAQKVNDASYRVLETQINSARKIVNALTHRQEALRVEIERLHEEHRQTSVALAGYHAALELMMQNDVSPQDTGITHVHTNINTPDKEPTLFDDAELAEAFKP